MSHPARGVWIETNEALKIPLPQQSHPARGVWIETVTLQAILRPLRSHPARGVWIETILMRTYIKNHQVAPRSGCVDWNDNFVVLFCCYRRSHPARGVWIETRSINDLNFLTESHPARGVWIETVKRHSNLFQLRRTPLGVCGLKHHRWMNLLLHIRSHPARGVWIETNGNGKGCFSRIVAPRSGCVDWKNKRQPYSGRRLFVYSNCMT